MGNLDDRRKASAAANRSFAPCLGARSATDASTPARDRMLNGGTLRSLAVAAGMMTAAGGSPALAQGCMSSGARWSVPAPPPPRGPRASTAVGSGAIATGSGSFGATAFGSFANAPVLLPWRSGLVPRRTASLQRRLVNNQTQRALPQRRWARSPLPPACTQLRLVRLRFAIGADGASLGQGSVADGTFATATGEPSAVRTAKQRPQPARAASRTAQTRPRQAGARANGDNATATGADSIANGAMPRRPAFPVKHTAPATAMGKDSFASGGDDPRPASRPALGDNATATGKGSPANGVISTATGGGANANGATRPRPDSKASRTAAARRPRQPRHHATADTRTAPTRPPWADSNANGLAATALGQGAVAGGAHATATGVSSNAAGTFCDRDRLGGSCERQPRPRPAPFLLPTAGRQPRSV